MPEYFRIKENEIKIIPQVLEKVIAPIEDSPDASITQNSAIIQEIIPKTIEYTDGDILDYIQEKFGDQTATALLIMDCESNGNKYAVSPTSDYGLFQINQIHFPEIPGETIEEKIEWLFDPINNIEFAYGLYQKSFWQPWVCAKILGIL